MTSSFRHSPNTFSGVPQGSVLSPILSNILLTKLDRFVETELIPQYNRGKRKKQNQEYNRLIFRARRLHRQGQKEAAHKIKQQAQKLPSIDPQDPVFFAREKWTIFYAKALPS